MKINLYTIVFFLIACSLLSCSTYVGEEVYTFNVLYCKKAPLGLKYNEYEVVEYKKLFYSPNIEGCYVKGKLHTLNVYKSDGVISYTNEDLKTDSLFAKYIGIPLNRKIIIHHENMFDNGTIFSCEKRGDSIFVKKTDEIIIYYNIEQK